MNPPETIQPNDYLVIQTSVVMLLVEALIATHPNPDEVRRQFDQLYGQFQSNLLASGTARPEHLDIGRQLIEKIFAPPESI